MNAGKKTITRHIDRKPPAALITCALLLGTTALAAVTPEQKCEGGKNDASGKYAACVAKAEKAFVTSGDATKYGAALVKCEDKLVAAWGKLEQKAVDAGAACPTTGDQSPIEDFLDACLQSVASALGGDPLPLDVATCNSDLNTCTSDLATCSGDLSTCTADLSSSNADLITCGADLAECESKLGVPKTGQTTAYGAGSDGDLERGVARSFTDNGDGTITDDVTGLMWEKKSDDGSIHDWENTYTWSTGTNNMDGTMGTTFLADLNSGGGFAGHTDWRIPNVYELESLRNFEVFSPAAFSEFNDSCTGGCTVTTCSCTRSDFYWSSSTRQSIPGSAWVVSSDNGGTSVGGKTGSRFVRAVRAGS